MSSEDDRLKRLISDPIAEKRLDALREALEAIATFKAVQDETKLYTKEEAILLYVAELRDRDGEELLSIIQQIDPMWDRYEWDEDTELFTPTGRQQPR